MNRHARRILPILLLGALAFVGAAPDAAAQTVTIFGTVMDSAGTPINDARVILEPADGGPRLVIVSKGEGTYSGTLPQPGAWRLLVEAEGKLLVGVNAKATKPDKSAAWEKKPDVRPTEGFAFDAEEGLSIQADLLLGDARTVAEATLGALTQRVQKGDCAGAVPELEKLAAELPQIPKTQYLLGFCRAGSGEDDKAVEALTKALEIQPKFPGAALLRGQILAKTPAKAAEAEASFKQEIATAANPQLVSGGWMALAALYREGGKTSEALAALQEVLKTDGTRRDAWAEMATVYAKSTEPDKAFEALERAKSAGVPMGSVAVNLGIAFYRAKDFARSERALRVAMEVGAGDRDLAIAYALTGQMQAKAGKKADAAASFQKSIELDPKGRLADEARQSLKALGK